MQGQWSPAGLKQVPAASWSPPGTLAAERLWGPHWCEACSGCSWPGWHSAACWGFPHSCCQQGRDRQSSRCVCFLPGSLAAAGSAWSPGTGCIWTVHRPGRRWRSREPKGRGWSCWPHEVCLQWHLFWTDAHFLPGQQGWVCLLADGPVQLHLGVWKDKKCLVGLGLDWVRSHFPLWPVFHRHHNVTIYFSFRLLFWSDWNFSSELLG